MSGEVEPPQKESGVNAKVPSASKGPKEGISPFAVSGDWIDLIGTGQVKKKILKKGSQRKKPRKYDLVEVNYEAYLPSGQKVERKFNLQFQLGDAEVVQGLEIAISWMEWQEVALIHVEPKFAYGSLGCAPSEKADDLDQDPKVPTETALVYMVELLCFAPEPDPCQLPVDQVLKTALKKKERGNWWYKRNEYYLAIKCYRRADEYIHDKEKELTVEMKTLRLLVWNNLATALLKMRAFEMALNYTNKVLKLDSENTRAKFLNKQILMEKGLKEVKELKPEEWEEKLLQHLDATKINSNEDENTLEEKSN